VEVLTYSPDWLPRLAALARAHARLVPPGIGLSDEDVERGLTRHAAWPFYSPGLEESRILLAVDGEDLLAAAQAGVVDNGWGYGAAPGDGPEWVHRTHLSLFWLFCWPGWPESLDAGATLAARVVGWTRGQGLPGLEAFRGGPGFLPFGTQLSRHWPHLWAPLRAAGFRQPRDLLAFSGTTAPDALPVLDPLPDGVTVRRRRGRVEAQWDGETVGVCAAVPLGEQWGWRWSEGSGRFADPRVGQWGYVRRLVVDAGARGLGIGAALFAAALADLDRRGHKRYLLHVPRDPEELPAIRLYGRFGRLVDAQQVLRLSF
jgi:GNAT superfamily N-acetyltransferase